MHCGASTVILKALQRMLLLVVLPSLLTSSLARAAEYSLQKGINVFANHNDNIRLTPTAPISLSGQSLQSTALAKIADANWDISLDADLRFNSFNRSEFDSDDQTVALAGNRETERQTFSLEAEVVRDSTRTSELESTGSGLVSNLAERRVQYVVQPQWTYLVTARNFVAVSGSFSQANYAGLQFTDYTYDSLRIAWTRVINENLRLTVAANGALYSPDSRTTTVAGVPPFTAPSFNVSTEIESESAGLQVGGEYAITENWSVSGLAGSTYTNQDYELVDPGGACSNQFLALFGRTPGACSLEDSDSNDLVADVSMLWSGERNEINLGYSIQNQPSNQGYEVEYERYSVSWNYRTTEKSRFRLSVEYGSNEAVDVSVSLIDPSNSNRDFGNATASYRWRVNENWRFNARYRYAWQDREQALGDAESNSIEIGVSYEPTKSIWSR